MAAISDKQFDALLGVLSDPVMASKLSQQQLQQSADLIEEYKVDRQERMGRLRAEGLNDEQIGRIETAFKEAPPPREGEIGSELRGIDDAGVAEGFKQGVEGVFDLAKDIEVALKLDDEQGRDKWKAFLSERRVNRRIENIKEFGQLPPKGWELMGNIAPFMLSVPAGAKTFWGLVTKRALQGGVIGASVAQPSGKDITDRLGNFTIGSVAGIATNVFNIYKGAKNAIARSITRAFSSKDAQARIRIENEVRAMTGSEDFGLSVQQVTGSRFASQLEQRTATQLTSQIQRTNIDTLAKHIFRKSRELSNKGFSAGQIALRLRNTLKLARKSIYDGATSAWGRASKSILDEFGDDAVIRGKDYLLKIDEIMAEQSDILVNMGGKPSKNLIKYRAEVDLEVNPIVARLIKKGRKKDGSQDQYRLFDRKTETFRGNVGERASIEEQATHINDEFSGIDAKATLRILKGLNNLISGDAVVFEKVSVGSNRNIGRALMGNFTAQLDGAEANVAAVEAINALRSGYVRQMERAQAIDETVFAHIFGGKKLPKNPGKKFDAVMRQEKEDLSSLREFLNEWDSGGSLLPDLQATHLRRLVRGSKLNASADADSVVDLNKLANRLSNEFDGPGSAGRGLHTPAVQRDLVLTGRALRALNNKWIKGGAQGFGVAVDDVAINVISRSPEFMARFLSRIASSSATLEARLLDPAWRRAVQEVAKMDVGLSNVGSQAQRAAMVYLAITFNQDDRQREEIAKQLQKQQQLDAAGRPL